MSGRNDPCPCGSGKKYKKCCLGSDVTVPGYGMTPSQLVLARAQAFQRNDFAFIYATYHSTSAFRNSFPDRDEYIAYGLATLNSGFSIEECRIICADESDDGKAWVLFYLRVATAAANEEYFELSCFAREDRCWRYLSSYRLPCSEASCGADEITMREVAARGVFL